jgi:hypothetical protein
VKRSDLPQLALDARHFGELLLHECKCGTRTHRWRYDTCNYQAPDAFDPSVTHRCRDGYITQAGNVIRCPGCWVSCLNGVYLAAEGDTDYRPCPLCKPHTVGEHLSRAADDMDPGPRAANTDPDTRGWRYDEDDAGEVWPIPNDTTGEAAIHPDATTPSVEWDRILNAIRTATRDGLAFVNRHRPDRHAPIPDPSTDNEYCRHHLHTLATCVARYRGDLCRTCYDFGLAYPNLLPTKKLLEIKEAGRRWNQQDVDTALLELKPPKPRSNKKGRRKAS